jgi:undecaprenyl-diphosphatase
MGSFISRFDNGITISIQNWPQSVKPVMEAASVIGEPVTVIFLAALSSAYAWQQNNEPIAWLFIATIVASLADALLKQVLQRDRPDTKYVTGMRIKSYSFPSGHAFGSLVTYGLLAYLAIVYLTASLAILTVACLAALILLIGAARVYLGAHYPTDILGGWVLGSAVLVAIIKYIQL